MEERRSNPDSLWSLIRRNIADLVDIQPKAGEAWCMQCSFNEGQTFVFQAEDSEQHVRQHVKNNPDEQVSIRANYGSRKGVTNGE